MRVSFALLAAPLIFALPARADFVVAFDRSNYDVTPGGTVQVGVALTETGTTVLTDNGLLGAGLLVHFNLPTTATDPAQVISIAPNPLVNPGAPDFDFLSTSIIPAASGSAGVAELDWGLTINTLFPASGGSSVLIGVFTFQAGSVAGDVTNLSTDLSGVKFVAGDGTVIDDTFGIASARATITVTTVPTPEPSSIVLLSVGVLVAAVLTHGRGRTR